MVCGICKGIYTTWENDRILVAFDLEGEMLAFEDIIERMLARVNKQILEQKPRETPIDDFAFKTTLEAQVAEDHFGEICGIIGLKHFRWSAKEDVYLEPLPECQRKPHQHY